MAAEQAVCRFGGLVGGPADRRLRPGSRVDDFFGDFGDAGFAERAPCGRVDAGDRVVEGAGDGFLGRAAPASPGNTN
jgi:hypothetical protein